MHIIFYGPEGSGKGTQAKLLGEKLKLPLLTSGDLVRDAAQNDKGLIGDAARKALMEGKYVPDSEMYVLWKNRLKKEDAKHGWILDGFPRNIKQAKFLLGKIKKYGYGLDYVIFLNISDDEAVKRLSKRKRKLFAGSTINHDDPVRVRGRLLEYRTNEAPLLDFFRQSGNLAEINGEQSIEAIQNDILHKIGKPRGSV